MITPVMKLKGGSKINFQIDTGVTCDILKLSSIKKKKKKKNEVRK